MNSQTSLLSSGFIASARKYKDNHALYVNNTFYTYSEIDELARKWANVMIEESVSLPKRIGIFASRSLVSYVSVLSSLFINATFVPINQKNGLDRTIEIINEAELDVIFVDKDCLIKLNEIMLRLNRFTLIICPEIDDVPKFNIPSNVLFLTKRKINKYSSLLTKNIKVNNDIAYLLFTSGSTGKPKGVPITHSNVFHFLKFNQKRYQFNSTDKFTQTFDQSFDLSVFDLFMAWNVGACVCSMNPIQLISPFQFIKELGITVWFSVPSIAVLLNKQNLLTPGSLESLRWSLFCGEPLNAHIAQKWQEAAQNSIVENLYGPTELTIACSVYRWNSNTSYEECHNNIVPIGQVYEGLNSIVINEGGEQVKDGEEGELCIAGPQMFLGYLNNKEKTEKSIFQLSNDPIKYYKTGDKVRKINENYIFMGRIDNQVKIKGYRIELNEIELEILKNENVDQAVVLPYLFENDIAQGIIALVTGNRIKTEALLNALISHFPSYMVPKEIKVLNEMPLNQNGKIDRNYLKLHYGI